MPIVSRMDCKYDDRLVNLTCLLGKPNSYTNQTVTIVVQAVREIKEIKLAAAYYVVTAESTNRILQRTVDLCSFVKRPNMDRLIKVFYDQVLQNNRFVTGCPVVEKELFYVRDLRPSAIRVPGFLPESSFIFENSYHTGVLFEAFVEIRYYGKLVRFVNDKPLESQKNKIKGRTAT
uniref:Sema domain-containing protein n=1 Tax=Anopheles maculatus TaxID=74869 RepID=A0A182SM14_9DIPT